jgi:hypothetical protein
MYKDPNIDFSVTYLILVNVVGFNKGYDQIGTRKKIIVSIVRKLGASPPRSVSRESPEGVLNLLEKKKKQVKKDGLYKFVLWREALRDEKSKVSSD